MPFFSASAKFRSVGRVVGWIAAEDDQQIDFAAVHVGDEIFERFGLVDRIRVDWVGVENGFADVAKITINLVGESMNRRRLMIANDNEHDPACAQLMSRPQMHYLIANCAPLSATGRPHVENGSAPRKLLRSRTPSLGSR